MNGCPQVRVRVAADSPLRLTPVREYRVTSEGRKILYVPASEESRMRVEGVSIGIDFHWQQRLEMLLAGNVETVETAPGRVDLYNILDAETYLRSVISSEMNPEAPVEFLKAHAIISRSWLLGKLRSLHHHGGLPAETAANEVCRWSDTGDHEGFDVCADDHCQRYQGEGRLNAAARQAVAETRGVALCDTRGEIIDARFSKCCGGRSELFSTCWQDVDYDYLKPVDDPYCDLSSLTEEERGRVMQTILVSYDRETVDFHDWTTRVSGADISRRMKERYGFDAGDILSLEADRRGPSGRISRLKVIGSKGAFFIGKELEIRRLLSDTCLYSSCFDVFPEGAGFRLEGRGWGHGVGLCQIGAAVMALKGKSCEEILSFYYPNTTLRKIYE